MNEAAFELEGFTDRTVHTFEAKLADDKELGFIVCRAELPAGRSLREAVEHHLSNETKRLSGFAILEQTETQWGGCPALEIRARWRHEGTTYYERQAHFVARGAWMFFGLTGPYAERATCDQRMDRVRDTLHLRDPD
jgi:hypothetical protein